LVFDFFDLHLNETPSKILALLCKRSRSWRASSTGTPWPGTAVGPCPGVRPRGRFAATTLNKNCCLQINLSYFFTSVPITCNCNDTLLF
jgi:hypothetical protein